MNPPFPYSLVFTNNLFSKDLKQIIINICFADKLWIDTLCNHEKFAGFGQLPPPQKIVQKRTEFKGPVRWWMAATVARPLDLLSPKFCDTHHFGFWLAQHQHQETNSQWIGVYSEQTHKIDRTANVYRQTTDELMFLKKCYFYIKMDQKMKYSRICYQVKHIDNWFQGFFISKDWTQ